MAQKRKYDALEDEIVNSAYIWLKSVLQENNWNCRQWALKAGVAPTTITRFIQRVEAKGALGPPFVPDFSTLCRLAAIAQKPLPQPGIKQKKSGR